MAEGLINNLFGSGQGPVYKPAGFDSNTVEGMDRYRSESGKSADEYAQSNVAGSREAGQGLLQGQEDANRSNLGGNVDPSMHGALQARAKRHFNTDMNQIERKAKVNAQGDRANNLSTAFGMQSQIAHANAENDRMAVQAGLNDKARRNAVVSGVLGTVGMIAGGIAGGMAGGPMGAMAGAGAGKALGNAAS